MAGSNEYIYILIDINFLLTSRKYADMHFRILSLIICFLCFCNFASLSAKVVKLDLNSRKLYQNGKKFGEIGTYEEIKGTVHFEVDPKNLLNQVITDIEYAQKTPDGRIAFSCDLLLLVPSDKSKINGSLIYEFNNRGTMLLPYVDATNHVLFKRGFVFLSTGWIGELLPNDQKLKLYAPVAKLAGQEIKGLVRQEIIGQKGKKRMSVNGPDHGAYEPTGKGYKNATLTRRFREADPRIIIDPGRFYLETSWADYTCERNGLPRVDLIMEDSFEADYIYELIYEARNPIVQGLGFAGIRDIISFFRYQMTEDNPLSDWKKEPLIRHVVNFGISQSGRAIRMFIYQGFNEDEEGRIVFDGAMPLVAGAGMGFFNHRFASPTRFSTQRESHLYPTDVFPFTYALTNDPLTGRRDGLLEKAEKKGLAPKIMHIQSSAEYWHRAAALSHTDPSGKADAPIPENVRIYSITGQHGSGNGISSGKKVGNLAINHTYYNPIIRALILAMDSWIKDNKTPPPSVYPNLKDKTLANWSAKDCQWSPIPGITFPKVIQQAFVADYGEAFESTRFITRHPPIIKHTYPVKIPVVDADNNEKGLLKMPAVACPTGTYTGWNLRTYPAHTTGDLLRLAGGYIPFARTKKERLQSGDPRLSIEERYPDFGTYFSQYKEKALELVEKGYLLEEELSDILELAVKNKKLIE